jgi:hypothetical protein
MNIAQLFHKLRLISNVEIVVPLFPEMLTPTQAKTGLEWATGPSIKGKGSSVRGASLL